MKYIFAAVLFALSNTALADRPCAEGFERVAPNMCFTKFVTNSIIRWHSQAECGVAFFRGKELPKEAKLAYVTLHWLYIAAGSVGMRENWIRFYDAPGCATEITNSQVGMMEMVPMPTGSVLGHHKETIWLPLCGPNTVCFTQGNAGGIGNAELGVAVKGYID